MECANTVCRRAISQARLCPVCKKLSYCSQQCRLDHWYAGHQLSCGFEQVQMQSKFRLEDFKTEEEKVLGKGSYGEVRLVVHVPTGDRYALKVVRCTQLNKSQFQKHGSLQVMKREILLHRALDHPNIIKLHDHMEDGENVYLVLELAMRGSLFHEIRRNKRLPEDRARVYFKQVSEGVHYLHENQIIHRDIKPENILLDAEGNLKICDFGWCAKGTEPRTTFCGTLDYMAPEMVVGGGHTFSVDVWALGVLLYEMVHGAAPFSARRESEKCKQIVTAQYTFDRALSMELKDLISGLLQQNPESRMSLSQAMAHPWVVRPRKEVSLLGARFKKFRKGVGVEEGVVTAVDGDCCTVEFLSGREQLAVAEVTSLIKRRKGLLGENSSEVSPVPSGSQSPMEEAALLEQIEQWCKAPSQPSDAQKPAVKISGEPEQLRMIPAVHSEIELQTKPIEPKRPPSLPMYETDQEEQKQAGVLSDDTSSDFSNPAVTESRANAPPQPQESSKPLFEVGDEPSAEPRATASFSPIDTFDFEHERQLIEEKNQIFYFETEERWAERYSQESVIHAPQLQARDPHIDSGGSNSLIEEVDRLASLTKRGPEDSVQRLQALEKANEALQQRKHQLEALLKEMDDTGGLPRVRRPLDMGFRTEGKTGFLRWIGSVIGCTDRVK